MSYHPGDTICAIATASGGAARGIVRVSGTHALEVVAGCFRTDDGAPLEKLKRPGMTSGCLCVALGAQHEPAKSSRSPANQGTGHSVPCNVFVWPTNRSYTREPVVELHAFGSRPVLESLLSALCSGGARLAEPGEFTLRAFLAGRLDLTQAEAVLGVIDSQGADELSAALKQLAGGFAAPLRQLRDDLLQLLAELEAGLDFVDEDIEFVSSQELTERLMAAGHVLDDAGEQMATRHTASQLNQVALVGPPNVGKSSLFNALVARYGVEQRASTMPATAALVSPQRGTTRDYLTATISLGGVRCELVDTAGVEELQAESDSSRSLKRARRPTPVDTAAQTMSAERGAQAVIRARCIDASQLADGAPATAERRNSNNKSANSEVFVLTKSDLVEHLTELPENRNNNAALVVTSSQTGEGLAELCATLRTLLERDSAAQRGEAIATTADRCRESIRLAGSALERAAGIVTAHGGDELLAVEIRVAVEELGKVVGAVYTDDLLDRIFSTFCIGK